MSLIGLFSWLISSCKPEAPDLEARRKSPLSRLDLHRWSYQSVGKKGEATPTITLDAQSMTYTAQSRILLDE